MTGTATGADRSTRPRWRSVAIPNEHGGWGLTAEPVLLGMLLAPSIAGLCLGIAALLAFLARTPLKLMMIDARHHRWIDRSRLAARVAAAELAAIAALTGAAAWRAGWGWLVPVAAAAPLVALEWHFDSRGRGRRLTPELAGAIGIAAVAAAIVVAGDGATTLAAAGWLVLAGRAVGSIPFVRVQIARLRRGVDDIRPSDLAQLAAVLVAAIAVVVDVRALAGAIGVAALGLAQTWWVRRPPIPPKQLGITQMVAGFVLVAVTAAGALAI